MAKMHPPRRQVSGSALLKVLGAVLLLGALGMLASTENALLAYRQAEQRHGGEVIDMAHQGGPRPGLYGYMVRVAGPIDVVAPPRDDDFNQSASTPVLVRHVEMFQWREVVVAGEAHYELDWVDRPVDSSHFTQPVGHVNPRRFPIAGRQFDSGQVDVGGFKLSSALLHALPGSVQMSPDPKALPPNLAASFSLHDGYLTTSAHPSTPRLGDLRVSWTMVPLQAVTVVARLKGDTLMPAEDAPDGKGYEVQVGDRSLVDIFPDLPVPPDGAMLRRVVAGLLAALGVLMLLWERRQHPSDLLLPVGLGALVLGAVGGVMWLGGGGRTGMHWFEIALLGLLLSAWPLWRRRSHDEG
ncbi:TMEM43 family protein [Dyella ginsengisoli]|uniref:TMEM43 family protein n=1 Tax=Dyella ginsengisoli TaxID=363848 RepID=UPI00034722D8|nr:TMEM43 family protein [Dyella ginsengisoli]